MKKTLFVIIALAIFMIGAVTAYTSSFIGGTVYAADGTTPVVGAEVSITCNGYEQDTTTDALGDYGVMYSVDDCDYGNAVNVIASYDGQTGENSGNMCNAEECDFPVKILDITIPEFGIIAGAFALLASIGIIAYRRN